MPWFMVDDKLHSHRKAVRAGVQAMGLWVLAGSWAADHLSDGFIPDYMALRIDRDAEVHAAELVDAGLWSAAERGGERGWQFHEWDDFQPTKDAVEAKREAARERMARVRGNKRDGSREVPANEQGTSQPVRLTPAQPIPSIKDSAADAAFETFWASYPKKVGKGQAVKAYRSAAKRADAAVILAGLEAARATWKLAGTQEKFIPNPTTWLNGDRWGDETTIAADPDEQLIAAIPTVEQLVEARDWGPTCDECERQGGGHFRGCSKAAS